MNRLIIWSAIFVFALLTLCIKADNKIVQDTDPFRRNQRLRRTINLGNALEAPMEGDWGMVIESEYFPTIKAAGFTAVRLPVRWSAHAKKDNPFLIDQSFLDRVKWVVDQSIQNDLAIVINMHHYMDLFASPLAHRERFIRIWQQIASYFREAPEFVFFELLNEPNSALDANLWNQVLDECTSVIRETNPDRTLIIGPSNWNHISADLDKLKLPDDNVILTVHYYEPFHFTHQGAEWVDNSEKWLGREWKGTSKQISKIESDFTKAAEWANKNGVPVFLGEFGAYSKADEQSRIKWTTAVRNHAEKYKFSWSYWEFGAGFGVYDRERKDWRESLLNSLLPDHQSN